MGKLKKAAWKTETYEYKDGFFIDIQKNDVCFEIWLFHKNCGIKESMFGLRIEDVNEKLLPDLVFENLENESYIEWYRKKYR